MPALPRNLTGGKANDQLLYFTSSSLTADDRHLVFISDRDSPVPKAADPLAQVNLYALDRRDGSVRRLTDNTEGYLRSYVYFEGLRHRGLGMASVSLHAESGDVYYLQGDMLCRVNARTGDRRRLTAVPSGHVTGFTHVSADNRRVCVPTIHESAFDIADPHRIDDNVQRLGLPSFLRIYDTVTGEQVEEVVVPSAWVTHVQFHPRDPQKVLFNHEWASDCGIRRIWLWDGSTLRRMRDEGTNLDGSLRRRADWVCHEVWSPDGEWIVYHGGHDGGASYVGRMAADGTRHEELEFPPGFNRYGHFTLGNGPGLLVSDGYAECTPEQAAALPAIGGGSGWGGHWLSTLEVDWERRTIRWNPICRHGSSWNSQDAHPHPVFNHAGDEVLFTSDGGGLRSIYAINAATGAGPG
ncbi:MAG: hypothetical protein WC661_18345 [Opitutaceae bacterium]|jgi:hypothetical protein